MDITYKMLKVLNAKYPTNAEIGRMLHIAPSYLCDIKKGRRDPYNMSLGLALKIANLYTEEMK